MVLTHKVGKQRSFPVVLLLFVVTFGIYGIYWNFRAHDEVYKQFELYGTGRDQGVVWLLMSYVFLPLLWVYHWLFVANVQHVRERLGARRSLSPGRFLGLSIPGAILVGLGLTATLIGGSLAATEAGEGVTQEAAEGMWDAAAVVTSVGVVMLLAGAALGITAFALLQRDINGLWRAYDRRMAALFGWRPV